MIDLRARRPPKPAGFDERRDVAGARAAIEAMVAAGREPRSSDFPPLWKPYKHLFARAQADGKCAYCETRVRGAYPGDIEHYRPRTSVAVFARRGNRKDADGTRPRRGIRDRARPGYWWLAYEWSNWLYACDRCNAWKSDQFPVKGRRRKLRPGAEAGEQATLINPFLCDPAPHFRFDESGQIHGATRAGRDTIAVCGLDRESLVHERGRVAAGLRRLIEDYEIALHSKNELATNQMLGQMHAYCRDDAPYAGMCRYLVRSWAYLDYQLLSDLARLGQI